ncbi:MAG: hypothetical protein ACR2MM_06855 [Flavobacteriaceae bacterium]
MDFTRSQLAAIITVFSLSIVILLLYNIHLGSEEKEEYIIEMSLADEDIIELLEEEERRLQELAEADPIKSHMASNETAKPSIGNPEPLKTLEELMAEQESDKEFLNADPGYEANLRELSKLREERKQQLGEKDAKKKEYTTALAEKRTSVSYSLVDRNNYDLPPPIYTCLNGGTVVINIKVDALGYVVEASFNTNSSNTSDWCLVENAVTYAYRARFDSSTKDSQIGTITYIFQSK